MGTLKLLAGFLVILFVVVACFEIAPPMLANYSFQDDIKTIAMVDSSNFQKTDEDVRTDVLRKAKEHDLPIEGKQIMVQRMNTPGNSAFYVVADYSVTINLPAYSFDMHFTPTSGNKQ
jgi:hypothetical protein